MLFSLEEACSFWSQKLMWRALSASLFATCTLCLLNGAGDIANLDFQHVGLISFRSEADERGDVMSWSLVELFPYAVTGVIGGLLGALLNKGVMWLAPRRSTSQRGKVLEVLALSLATTLVSYCVTFYTPSACVRADHFNFTMEGGETVAEAWRFNCEEGSVNQLASVLFADREEAIKHIMTSPQDFSYGALFSVFSIFYFFLQLTMTSAVPCGLFMPSIMTQELS